MDLDLLLDRCRARDELAWEALVRQFQSRVYGIACHYLGSAEDARDLAQDVFIRIYNNLNSCPNAQVFLPWVIRITRNASVDHIRRAKVRPPASDIPAEVAHSLAAQGVNPEEQCALNSRRKLIHRALQQLSALNREVILLKEIQGLALEQIASLLEVPLGTIKSRSNRARLELAEKVLALERGGAAGGVS